ncbi:hypothetical protein RI129_000457 [Pyrocoelia pectoralis]|uniref:Phospholipase A2-like domain-containing protein n=1 Tax=Pyrocoelia pectoralis TaxID=417401 RepID=A0AAN7VSV4_9COLE
MLIRKRKSKVRGGSGLVNTLINKLPFELHLPGYQYCGPGTKLTKRLERGDPGINPLDASCKEHDISYRDNKDLESRHKADSILERRAWDRLKAADATAGERAAALTIGSIMRVKRKLGMGVKRRGGERTNKRSSLANLRRVVAKKMKKSKNTQESIKSAITAAKLAVKNLGGKGNVNVPRVIPLPKEGGFLPFLIPLFAGLSAVGALAGGASGIAKAVNASRDARKMLEETSRHNHTMESIAIGKKSGGVLYLKPYKNGGGIRLHLNKKKKN